MTGIIYCITNTINGKQYVGQTTYSLAIRWKYHQRAVNIGSLHAIHRAIRKYGVSAFTIEPLDSASSCEELNKKEIHYIALLTTFTPTGYNLTLGGGGISDWHHSDLTKQKIAATLRKTRCKHGHLLSGENLYISPGDGKRHCWTCIYLRQEWRKIPERLRPYLENIA